MLQVTHLAPGEGQTLHLCNHCYKVSNGLMSTTKTINIQTSGHVVANAKNTTVQRTVSHHQPLNFSKAKNQKILKTLNAGYSLRQTALLCKSSLSLVVKVRNLATEVGSIKSAEDSSTKTQLTNEEKLRLFIEKEGIKV